MPDDPIFLSVVVPAFNEAESLAHLHGEILGACLRGLDGVPYRFEVIFIDDGSTDDTREVCRGLSPLRYVRFSKNCGQTAALDCGFSLARGEYVAALDGDGQNDPNDIPALLSYLRSQGLDAVSGWRRRRNDSLGKRIASLGAYVLRQLFLGDGVHDSGCTLKVYRRDCLEGLGLRRGLHRFIPAILMSRGYKVGELTVSHRPRSAGKSKYGASRLVEGLRDLFALRRDMRHGAAKAAGSSNVSGPEWAIAEQWELGSSGDAVVRGGVVSGEPALPAGLITPGA